LSIELPPLRQRKEDIPALADHFLAIASDDHAERLQLSGPALECLVAYEWPGNVRELENCMRWAVAWRSGPLIHPDDLPPYVRKPHGSSPLSLPDSQRSITMQEIERQVILRAIVTAKGNKVTAARSLGISKTTIYRKLKEYGISRFPRAGAPPLNSNPDEP
jgi:DNA-binding NtrC family response regulator